MRLKSHKYYTNTFRTAVGVLFEKQNFLFLYLHFRFAEIHVFTFSVQKQSPDED